MLVKSLDVMEENLKSFLSDPDNNHDLKTAVSMAKEILIHKKDSSYAQYALALNEIVYANRLAPLSDFTSSIERLKRLIKLNPKFLEAHLMLAKIYGETDKDLELKTLAKANKIFPNHYLIMYDLASLKLFKTGEKEEALELLFKCVQKLPQLPNNWAMLGTAYIMLREFEMAKTCFETALNLEPDHLNSVLGIGVYHFENANFVKAREYYQKSLKINKDSYYANFNIALLEILEGNFKKGIELHEKRDKKAVLKKYGGSGYIEMQQKDVKKNTNNKILVIKEQGYGDDIMFSRYLNFFKSLGYNITLATNPELINLLKASPDLDDIKIVSSLPELSPDTFDFRTHLMSLPYLLSNYIEEKPKPIYICEKRIKSKKLKFQNQIDRTLNNKKLKVGITWSGNPKHWRDKNRSIELEMLQTLFSLEKVEFYAIQKVFEKREEKILKQYKNVNPCSEYLYDFAHTAYLTSEMDLIISVDTSLVHLAGSMNKKTYLMTPVVPDWRWGLEKTQDWYPSISLIRQEKIGCWIQPIQKMKKLLNSKI